MKSHFNVEFALKNLPNQVNQTKASKMAVFTNGRVLAGLKIRHFRGLTVLCKANQNEYQCLNNFIACYGIQVYEIKAVFVLIFLHLF